MVNDHFHHLKRVLPLLHVMEVSMISTDVTFENVHQHGSGEVTQEETFTKWLNDHLKRALHVMEVNDLYDDLRDGLVSSS